MTNELRKLTNKTLVFDMTIPVLFHNLKINMTSENIVKMLPQAKNNIILKISLYGIPTLGSYQEQKLNLLDGVANTTGIPLYSENGMTYHLRTEIIPRYNMLRR